MDQEISHTDFLHPHTQQPITPSTRGTQFTSLATSSWHKPTYICGNPTPNAARLVHSVGVQRSGAAIAWPSTPYP